MKFIIKENQLEKVSAKKKAIILSKLFDSFYPNLSQSEITKSDIDIKNDESDELIFYYRPKSGEFFVSLIILQKLYEKTGLPFLNYESVKTNKRHEFDEIIKEFAKYHFGFNNVEDVYFHWY
jgi:hypothetical protein